MKMVLKLDRKQDPRQAAAWAVNDLIEEGYTVTSMGPNSVVLVKEGHGGKKKFARVFVLEDGIEVIKRAE